MSALIVSQERLHETHSSFKGRILGTLLGIAVQREFAGVHLIRISAEGRSTPSS